MKKGTAPSDSKGPEPKPGGRTVPSNERIKSCFSKKNMQSLDHPSEPTISVLNRSHLNPDNSYGGSHPSQEEPRRKTVFSTKRKANSRMPKDAKEPRDNKQQTLQLHNRLPPNQKHSSDSNPDRSSPETVVEECIRQISDQVLREGHTKKEEEPRSPVGIAGGKDRLVSNCSVETLKSMTCQKLNDCQFFDDRENLNKSKRLLFLEYHEKEIYINSSREKEEEISPTNNVSNQASSSKEPLTTVKQKIPQEIQNAFGLENSEKKKNNPSNFFAININSKLRTESTEVTSSNKHTPSSLTPRSMQDASEGVVRSRGSSFTHNNNTHMHQRNISGSGSAKKGELDLVNVPNLVPPLMPIPEMGYPSTQYEYYNAPESYQYYDEASRGPSRAPSTRQNTMVSNNGRTSNRRRRAITGEEKQDYVIDLEKVEEDGRTTVMIRNIPNKFTRDDILALIHETHLRKYDFFYLPLDENLNVKHGCNLGFAFINFLHPKFIKDFYSRFNGRTWEQCNSPKICELTYARIQGTLNLMLHFQDSNVYRQSRAREREGPLILDQNGLEALLEKQRMQKD